MGRSALLKSATSPNGIVVGLTVSSAELLNESGLDTARDAGGVTLKAFKELLQKQPDELAILVISDSQLQSSVFCVASAA